MLKRITMITACASLVMIGGCAGNSNGYYLKKSFGFDSVCLVDNKNVPAQFFIALRKALEDKGLEVTTISKCTDDEILCPATVMYEAKYSSVPVPYLQDARLLLKVKNEKTQVVKLKNSQKRVLLLDKMADSETAIRDMVNRMLPRSTPW